jgi:multidrug efflux system outer membrane protein
VTQQRSQCDVEVKALVALSGMPEPQLRQLLLQPWQEPQEPLLPLLSLPAQLLAQRPDVYQAEREVAAASDDIGSAQAQRYPRLSLSGSIAAGLVRIGGATTNAQTWSIGPVAFTLPLFDGGRRAANVEAAKARYEEAAALYASRVRQAVREVEEALVNLESARLRLEDARTAFEGYRASFTATEARYRSGLGSLVELEDARRTALAAETALVNLQRERLAAWIALYRAAGGGWARPATPSA